MTFSSSTTRTRGDCSGVPDSIVVTWESQSHQTRRVTSIEERMGRHTVTAGGAPPVAPPGEE